MLTRQGRKSDDSDDRVTAALRGTLDLGCDTASGVVPAENVYNVSCVLDAGIENVETMAEEEKRELYNAIIMSSRVSSQGNDEHFQRDSPGSPERSPNSEVSTLYFYANVAIVLCWGR